MTQWFGTYWGAPICDETEHVDTPVGESCQHCSELITERDDGVVIPSISESGTTMAALHLDCHLRGVLGSVGHLKHRCSCYGGNESDPLGMTKREAATAAVRYYRERGEK